MVTLLLGSRRYRPSIDPFIISFIMLLFVVLQIMPYNFGIAISTILVIYFTYKCISINSYNKYYDSIIQKYESCTNMNDSIRVLYDKFNNTYGFQINELYFKLILMAYQDHLIMNLSSEHKNVIIEPKSKYLNLFINMMKMDDSYFNDIKTLANKCEPYSYINLSQDEYDTLLIRIQFQVYRRHLRIDRCLNLHIKNKGSY